MHSNPSKQSPQKTVDTSPIVSTMIDKYNSNPDKYFKGVYFLDELSKSLSTIDSDISKEIEPIIIEVRSIAKRFTESFAYYNSLLSDSNSSESDREDADTTQREFHNKLIEELSTLVETLVIHQMGDNPICALHPEDSKQRARVAHWAMLNTIHTLYQQREHHS